MKPAFQFTGDREADWKAICRIWQEDSSVMSGAVGPLWVMPPQHKVCIEFAEYYPDSKDFLIGHLSDPDPRIAAYAFKILIRICKLSPADLPSQVACRKEKIEVLAYCRADQQKLCDFFSDYFDSESSEPIAAADERAISWQNNELERYLKATQNPEKTDQDRPSDEKPA